MTRRAVTRALVRRTLLVGFGFAALVLGPVFTAPEPAGALPGTASPWFVPAPAGMFYGSVAWSDKAHRLIVGTGVRAGVGEGNDYLATVRLEGTDFKQLPVPRDPACSRELWGGARSLRDGRIAFIDQCVLPAPCAISCVAASLRTYDFTTGRTGLLRPYKVRGGCMSFSPKTGRGIIAESNGLVGHLSWLGSNKLVSIKLPLSEVGCATWSADGRRIVIDGIPTSAGPNSPTRANIPWALYLLDGNAHLLGTLLAGLNDDAWPAWSPDGHWLAYRDGTKYPRIAIRLLDMRDSSAKPRLLLDHQALGAITWLPNSRRLIVTVGNGADASLGYHGPFGLFVVPVPAH